MRRQFAMLKKFFVLKDKENLLNFFVSTLGSCYNSNIQICVFSYISWKYLVAQMLTASGNELFYYTWPKDATHNYEIDFLVSRGSKICPIEVKSSGYKSHASLDAFSEKFSKVILQKYLFYGKDLQKDGNTLLLPFYMTPFV